MKSANTSYIHTALTSPTNESSIADGFTKQKSINSFNESKMFEYMKNTLKSVRAPFRILSNRNHQKPRITILPLTKEKIKVRINSKVTQRKDLSSFLNTQSSKVSPIRSGIQGHEHLRRNDKVNHFQEFFIMMSFMYNKKKRKSRKLQLFIEQMISYFKIEKGKQLQKQIQQINKISALIKKYLLQETGSQFNYDLIKMCEGQLCKLIFNICYEIYLLKSNSYNLNNLYIVHRDIQYYSRRLNMLGLTLISCMDMGKYYCLFHEYDKSCLEYSKSIKLAVFLEDKYFEELAIDRLGMCHYYKGDTVTAQFYHSSINRLSPYEITKIKQQYSNEEQIREILQHKTNEKIQSAKNIPFCLQNKENTVDFNFDITVKNNNYPQQNYDKFRHNLKQMIKVSSLRNKVSGIKATLSKTSKIGQKRYNGKDYFLPKASKFYWQGAAERHEEILMSHSSFNRNNVSIQSYKIERDCKIIDQILNFFQNEKRHTIKEISINQQSD